MAEMGRGRSQIPPGPWSLAVSQAIAAKVDTRPGKRKRFALESGFSGRLSSLLNGERAWYLEDVERACTTLGLDVVGFLESLMITEPARLLMVADADETYSSEDVDAEYEGGA